jgi:hypothetical protein
VSECREWTGRRDPNGYGRTTTYLAHRVAWELEHGVVPDNLVVMHTCDNPACTEVEHLRLGTRAENQADMKAKGRSTRGERHPNTRLAAVEVLEIRASTEPKAEVAERFGISISHVYGIQSRRKWTHLNEPKGGNLT